MLGKDGILEKGREEVTDLFFVVKLLFYVSPTFPVNFTMPLRKEGERREERVSKSTFYSRLSSFPIFVFTGARFPLLYSPFPVNSVPPRREKGQAGRMGASELTPIIVFSVFLFLISQP